MDNVSYIYTVAHPFTGEIKYVGVTQDLKLRISNHLSSASGCPGVSGFIRELRDQYILPKIEVLDIVDRSIAYQIESYWIFQLKAWGFELLNFVKYKSSVQEKRKVIITKNIYLKGWSVGETRKIARSVLPLFKDKVKNRNKDPRILYCFTYSDDDKLDFVLATRVEHILK